MQLSKTNNQYRTKNQEQRTNNMAQQTLKIFIVFLTICVSTNANSFQTLADYTILMENESGSILYSKNADKKMAPSSMTKLMTVYIIFDRIKNGLISFDDTFLVSKKAWKKGGSKMFVKHNDKVSVRNLLYGVIVQSGNDACIVLAEGIASSENDFARIMNETAKNIGLTNSNFKNSTGWPAKDHYMSARDIAILSRAIINDFPEYYKMFAKKTFTYSGIKQNNRNSLLHGDIGVDGLKTGHTEDAGYGIATSAIQGNTRLISVVNGLNSQKERINETERLLNHGYRYFEKKTLFSNNKKVSEAEVWMGEKKTVSLVLSGEQKIMMPKINKSNIQARVIYEGPFEAPIKKGEKLAKLIISIPNMESKAMPLFAGEDVAEAKWHFKLLTKVKLKILNLLK